MEISELFKEELSRIKDDEIRGFAKESLDLLPEYFSYIPASSTGKYHPQYALGDGGLVRHTKAAVRIALALFGNKTTTSKFSDRDKDLIVAALLVHDGTKSGIEKTKYTKTEHPLLCVAHLTSELNTKFPGKYTSILGEVRSLIECHMGEWNKDYQGHEITPLPKTPMERFVHMCDYLASRKIIEINFDAEF